MHGPDAQRLSTVLEGLRDELVAAVDAWRSGGGKDDDLAVVVDARHAGKPSVSTMDRQQLKLTIPDFDPVIAIEFARNLPGQAPVVIDVAGLVRRVVWMDLTPPFAW